MRSHKGRFEETGNEDDAFDGGYGRRDLRGVRVLYHWFSEDENVYIASPFAQTTEVEIDTAFDSSTFSLTVEAIRDDRTYRSTLMASCPTNGGNVSGTQRGLSPLLHYEGQNR